MAESVFRDVLLFFDRLGIYDVVLPFLLVFTIMFAILERTKVFGTEKLNDEEITKKNLNAMTAFVTAFLVIASSQAVAIISKTLQMVFLLLLISICFLLLIGTFFGKDEVKLEGGWRTFMMVIMFIAIALVFAYAIPMSDGTPFLEFAFDYLVDHYDSTAVSSIVLAVGLIALIWFIVRDPNESSKGGGSDD